MDVLLPDVTTSFPIGRKHKQRKYLQAFRSLHNIFGNYCEIEKYICSQSNTYIIPANTRYQLSTRFLVPHVSQGSRIISTLLSGIRVLSVFSLHSFSLSLCLIWMSDLVEVVIELVNERPYEIAMAF